MTLKLTDPIKHAFAEYEAFLNIPLETRLIIDRKADKERELMENLTNAIRWSVVKEDWSDDDIESATDIADQDYELNDPQGKWYDLCVEALKIA